MRLGVIHYNFPQFTFEQFLDYCPQAGFNEVELQIGDVWRADTENPEAEAERVLKMVQERGLRVSALAAGNDFVVLDPEAVQRQVDRMVHVVKLASILECDVIRTEGGQPKPEVPEDRWVEAMAGCLCRVLDALGETPVKFAVDNHGWCTNDGDRQLALIQAVGSPNVGVNLDTMNYRWFGHDIPTINRYYEILAPYVFHTHMKDGTGSREQYRGAVLGEGEIDLLHAIRCLKKAGYEGVWCVEYEGPPPTDVGYRKCGEWLRSHLQ